MGLSPLPTSPRLAYRVLTPEHTKLFYVLAIDSHIREYLLDGQVMSLSWAVEAVKQSQRQFDAGEFGLWLVSERSVRTSVDAGPLGFAGFWRFPELGPEPQLIYALKEDFAGRGYATEIGGALMHHAHAVSGVRRFFAAVDEPNSNSIRVLEKLGFHRTGEVPGAFGRTLLFEKNPGSE